MKLHLTLGAICLVLAVVAKDDKKEKDEVGTVIGIDLGTTYSW
jgi:transposase